MSARAGVHVAAEAEVGRESRPARDGVPSAITSCASPHWPTLAPAPPRCAAASSRLEPQLASGRGATSKLPSGRIRMGSIRLCGVGSLCGARARTAAAPAPAAPAPAAPSFFFCVAGP